jgi:hypothetical protein
MAHGDLETQVAVRVRDLARQTVQDHLDLRAENEVLLAEVKVMLGMSADAKGMVMRTEAPRESTAKAQTSQKLSIRLSAGEKPPSPSAGRSPTTTLDARHRLIINGSLAPDQLPRDQPTAGTSVSTSPATSGTPNPNSPYPSDPGPAHQKKASTKQS